MYKYLIPVLVFSLGFPTAHAESKDHSAARVDIDRPEIEVALDSSEPMKELETGYMPAKAINRAPPLYPRSRAAKAHAGMVELSFMVGPDGRIFETIPLRSTHKAFERNAVDAVNQYVYAPATLDGVPIASRETIRVVFAMMREKDAVVPEFHKLYRSINKQLKKPRVDVPLIQNHIKRLRNTNNLSIYSLAQIAKLEVIFGQDHSSDEDYLEALQMLILFEGMLDEQASFLPTELLISLKQKIIDLNLQLGRFAESVSEYEELALEDEQAASVFDQAIEQIRDLRKLKRSHAQNTKIVANRHTEISLIGDRVKLRSVTGTLEALKFRCSAKFFETPFELEKEYEIPDEWGHCHMEIVGEPGSTAEVIQSYSKA